MKLIFMGTPDSAVPTLSKLIESQHQILAVVSQPDKPAGRGRKIKVSPVKQSANDNDIPVLQPDKLKNNQKLFDQLNSLKPDVIVVVAYGKILPLEALNIPKHFCVNVHFSLLPKYRGAAPVQWAIINGERKTGVTIMKMDESLDTGDIILQEQVDILEDDDAVSLTNMLSVVGANLLLNALDKLQHNHQIETFKQDNSQATYAPSIKKEFGLIDWNQPAEQIICLIRGLVPWPCAYSFLDGNMMRIWKAELYPLEFAPPQNKNTKISPGTVTNVIKGKGFTVRTGDLDLLITGIQPENRRHMSGADFVNGGYVDIGYQFK